jgi:hypothetical protein
LSECWLSLLWEVANLPNFKYCDPRRCCPANKKAGSYLTKARKFDRKFNKEEGVTQFLDMSKAERHGKGQRRVNVDSPAWMIESLDRKAKRLGVTRQSLIEVWTAERLEKDKPTRV